MNKSEEGETWNETKHKLKQKLTSLNGSDALVGEGEKEETIERLQSKLSKSKKEIEKLISEL